MIVLSLKMKRIINSFKYKPQEILKREAQKDKDLMKTLLMIIYLI